MNKICSQPLTVYIHNSVFLMDSTHTPSGIKMTCIHFKKESFHLFLLTMEDARVLSNFNWKQNLSTVKGHLYSFQLILQSHRMAVCASGDHVVQPSCSKKSQYRTVSSQVLIPSRIKTPYPLWSTSSNA